MDNELILLIIMILIIIFVLTFVVMVIHSFRKEAKADIEARALRNELNKQHRTQSIPSANIVLEESKPKKNKAKTYSRRTHKKDKNVTKEETNFIETHYL